MDRTNNVVELRNVAIYHSDGDSRRIKSDDELVLSDVNLTVASGELVYFIGRVGSGKSTLLKTLYAEVQLLEGEGRVAGMDLRRLRRGDIPPLASPHGHSLSGLPVAGRPQRLLQPLRRDEGHGVEKRGGYRRRIDEVLSVAGLSNKAYKMPHELSGGEQQRLVIARALLNDPKVLLADEPTGNLDPVTAEEIIQLFRKIAARGCAVVMSTHNTALLENHPTRSILFSQGRIQEINLEEKLS